MPSSGVLVLPRMTSPARLCRATSSLSWSATKPLQKAVPLSVGVPLSSASRSLSRKGTPRSGPSGSAPLACARARSNTLKTTAFRRPSRASMRSMAASTSSAGETSLFLTSAASPTPSKLSYAEKSKGAP